MGSILARFKRKQTTMDILEGIDTGIKTLLKFKRRDNQLEKQYLGSLLIYSIVIYIAGAFFFYLSFSPKTWMETVIQVIPLLIFPIVIWGIRKLLQWYFIKRNIRNDLALEDLMEKKKIILEDVKEKESYKKAKEILERFDPSSRPATPSTPPATAEPTGLRQRQLATQISPSVQLPKPRQGYPKVHQRPNPAIMMSPSHDKGSKPPVTPRPILPQQRGTVDKLMDFLVGDGPENRYALICKQCHSHNGMALREEFEYLIFKCAYCSSLNPARKQLPNAPKLPEVSLREQSDSTVQQITYETEVKPILERNEDKYIQRITEDFCEQIEKNNDVKIEENSTHNVNTLEESNRASVKI